MFTFSHLERGIVIGIRVMVVMARNEWYYFSWTRRV